MHALKLSRTCASVVALCLPAIASAAPPAAAEPVTSAASAAQIQRGRYLVGVGHCNNCHTARYAETAGQVPEPQWLLGNPVGWRSKAGTVYAPNLRLYMEWLSSDTWLVMARQARPRQPMPWWSLRDMSDADLTAMYWYIQSLRPVGAPAPAFQGPGQVPAMPYSQLPDLSPRP